MRRRFVNLFMNGCQLLPSQSSVGVGRSVWPVVCSVVHWTRLVSFLCSASKISQQLSTSNQRKFAQNHFTSACWLNYTLMLMGEFNKKVFAFGQTETQKCVVSMSNVCWPSLIPRSILIDQTCGTLHFPLQSIVVQCSNINMNKYATSSLIRFYLVMVFSWILRSEDLSHWALGILGFEINFGSWCFHCSNGLNVRDRRVVFSLEMFCYKTCMYMFVFDI